MSKCFKFYKYVVLLQISCPRLCKIIIKDEAILVGHPVCTAQFCNYVKKISAFSDLCAYPCVETRYDTKRDSKVLDPEIGEDLIYLDISMSNNEQIMQDIFFKMDNMDFLGKYF